MRLVLVELTRFCSRRAVVVVLLAAAALTALMATSTAYNTRPVSETELAAAETMLEQERAFSEEEIRECRSDPERYFDGAPPPEGCSAMEPQLEWFLDRPLLDLATVAGETGLVLLFLLAAVGILVGTTFSGADWGTGSMGNQLLFRPRRVPVWLAKGVAVTVGATLAAAVVLVAFWGALYVVALTRDIATTAEDWEQVLGYGYRGLALVAAVSLGSFALTMLLRSTVGTLGLLFGYAVVGEGLAATLPIDKMSQWSLTRNVFAWLQDGVTVIDGSICDPGTRCDPSYLLTSSHAAAYLGALLLLAVVASLVAFRSRDVP